MRRNAVAFAALIVAGCASHAPAPVIERGTPAAVPAPAAKQTLPALPAPVAPMGEDKSLYTVKKGDTLYSIALEHGRDYKDVAAWNNLENSSRIQAGQQLRVVPPQGETPVAVARPIVTAPPPVAATSAGPNTETLKRQPKVGKLAYSEQALARMREAAPATAQHEEKPADIVAPPAAAAETGPRGAPMGDDPVVWAWPAQGKSLANYTEGGTGANKGIDIGGRMGEPVQAAAAGKVVYVGSGLRGYGNLVIVRHNAAFLSAYAHNSKILVTEGQAVVRGQKIAEIGSSDADQIKLHFEIRHQGKPVDPLKYLPAR